jgi:quinohemoprotein ethanol dehydrogenase
MSFNPRTGLVYVPAQDNSFAYIEDSKFAPRRDGWNTGIDFTAALATPGAPQKPPVGFLLAWDPVAQKERWRAAHAYMWNGGTLTTAGNLVFQGTADGRLVAYLADTGDKVWEMAVGSPINAPPVTYELDGTQYVAVMAAWGGAPGSANPFGQAVVPGRLLVFALGAGGTVAPLAGSTRPAPVAIAVPPTPAAALTRGEEVYGRWCSMCHGIGAASGGLIPDLRYSPPEVDERYQEIVLAGALVEKGMPSFERSLSEADVVAVRAYVLARRALISK